MSRIKAIILDWAGTAVDYGCFAPVDAFMAAFADFGIYPTMQETRAPMGLQKRAHIAKMLENRRLAAAWEAQHGRPHTQADIDKIYSRFEPALFSVLTKYADPLPGVLDAIAVIRAMGIKIGSTTGYTQAMMDVVVPLATEKGYLPDCIICPDDVGGIGRPYPYMLWRNLEKLGIESIESVLKVGDTAADMEEGRNAGCLSVGIIKGSSMLGLTEAELAEKNNMEKAVFFESAKRGYLDAGADYVLEDISALPGLIQSLEEGTDYTYV